MQSPRCSRERGVVMGACAHACSFLLPWGRAWNTRLLGLFIMATIGAQLDAVVASTLASGQDESSVWRDVASWFHSKVPAHATEHKAETLSQRKPVRGYMDGCFDIMHSGHFNALRQGKALCDVLVVGIHSNEEIEKNKGPPVMSDEERVSVVKACKWVDEIVLAAPYDATIELLDKHNCDFALHGDDISPNASGVDCFAVVRKAGRMKTFKRTEGVSTTDLVARMLRITEESATPVSLGAIAGNASSSAAMGSLIKSQSPISPSSAVDSSSSGINLRYAQGKMAHMPTFFRLTQFSKGNRRPTSADKIVYTAGSFDLFNTSDVQLLETAKSKGTFLYVGIYDDAVVAQIQGNGYPVMSVHERCLNVLACSFVDEVIIGVPFQIPSDLIASYNVQHIVCRAQWLKQYSERNLADPCEHIRGHQDCQIEIVQTPSDLLPHDITLRIAAKRASYAERTAKRGAKELEYLKQKKYVSEL